MRSKAKISADDVTVAWDLCLFTNIMYKVEVMEIFILCTLIYATVMRNNGEY
jgi:hypothetical protein